jgi:hypothetical protein
MSRAIQTYLRKYPLLTRYARNGIVNLNAFARLIKGISKQTTDSTSLAALGMDLRRYIAKTPKVSVAPFDFSKYSLQLITRTNIHEIILNKNLANRKRCLGIVSEISQTKYFVSVVEGEKEIVVMTDQPLRELLKIKGLKNIVNHKTGDLGFISVNFPIELRNVPGIYSLITSSLAEAEISIHSFHTIGGEILILVKNEDLVHTQEVLRSLLVSSE